MITIKSNIVAENKEDTYPAWCRVIVDAVNSYIIKDKISPIDITKIRAAGKTPTTSSEGELVSSTNLYANNFVRYLKDSLLMPGVVVKILNPASEDTGIDRFRIEILSPEDITVTGNLSLLGLPSSVEIIMG